jgi:alpha-galactosidase
LIIADITITDDLTFRLCGPTVEYSLRVEPETGELLHVHFGGSLSSPPPPAPPAESPGWVQQLGRKQREFPDLGRGDFRSPAIRIRQNEGRGSAICHFRYSSHEVIAGKPQLEGLPCTFGQGPDVQTLVIHLKDVHAKLTASLSYTIFPNHSAIVRSIRVANHGPRGVVIEEAASFSVDMPHNDEWEMMHLTGDWAREANIVRRKVHPGTQG